MTEKMLIVPQSQVYIYYKQSIPAKNYFYKHVYCYLIRMKQFNAYQA